MKLQTRTNVNYVFFSAIIYIVVTGSFYLAVEYVIYDEVDRRLLVEKGDFEHFIDRHNYWETSCYFVEDKIDVRPVLKPSAVAFRDTLLMSRHDAVLIPFRQVSFDKTIGGKLYRVNIRKSLIESNHLLKIITVVMLIVLSGGLTLLYLFLQRTSKRLWRPFYETLAEAKAFNVHQGDKLTLTGQEIFEFNELNSSLKKMTERIMRDYRSLREFTENASHEIQTPLALISSRVEGLIQDNTISGKHMRWIQDIYESAMRLSKLNHALLLLAKIENGQFHDTEMLDLKSVIERHLSETDEVYSLKSINLSVNLEESFYVRINQSLAEVLISNLLNNAVRHNLPREGTIGIALSAQGLSIFNTGLPLTVEPTKLFERFQKQSKKTSSLGLGLAIVKKICDISHLKLEYTYRMGLHTITITKIRAA